MASGTFFLILGPSGVGKTTVIRELRKRHPEWHFAKSATTRPRRKGEGDEQYYFVSDLEFDQFLKEDALLEWAQVHKNARYGIIKHDVLSHLDQGYIVIREADVQGLDHLKACPFFTEPDGKYHMESIFILPESTEQLIAHITKRGPAREEELQKRLASIKKEVRYANECTHQIISREGKLNEMIEAMEKIIHENTIKTPPYGRGAL